MKKLLTFCLLLLVLLLSLILFLLVKQSTIVDKYMIESRIQGFTEAYNNGDMDGVVDCMDRKTKNTYKSAMNITNALIGKSGFRLNMSDLFGFSVGGMSDGDMLSVSDINIHINENNSADVYATLGYTDKLMSEKKTYEDVCFVMTKEGFNWFIQDMKSIQE